MVVLRAKASSKIGSSLKPNHHDIVKFVKISETHCSLSKFLIHIVDSQDSSETLNQNETPKKWICLEKVETNICSYSSRNGVSMFQITLNEN